MAAKYERRAASRMARASASNVLVSVTAILLATSRPFGPSVAFTG